MKKMYKTISIIALIFMLRGVFLCQNPTFAYDKSYLRSNLSFSPGAKDESAIRFEIMNFLVTTSEHMQKYRDEPLNFVELRDMLIDSVEEKFGTRDLDKYNIRIEPDAKGGINIYNLTSEDSLICIKITKNGNVKDISYEENIMSRYRVLDHQIFSEASYLKRLSYEICPEEGRELGRILSVFSAIVEDFRNNRKTLKTAKRTYRGRKIDVNEAVDILQVKAIALNSRILEMIKANKISKKDDSYYLYNITFQINEMINKYAKGKKLTLVPLNLYLLLMEFKRQNSMSSYDISIAGAKDVVVIGSVAEFFEVLNNLRYNAYMHGDAKNIYINIKRKGDRCELIFRDDGRGMSKKVKEKAFEKWFSTNKSKFGHEGLGLAVVKSIIESWGGTINLASEYRKGTTFTMTLPLGPGEAVKILPPEEGIQQLIARIKEIAAAHQKTDSHTIVLFIDGIRDIGKSTLETTIKGHLKIPDWPIRTNEDIVPVTTVPDKFILVSQAYGSIEGQDYQELMEDPDATVIAVYLSNTYSPTDLPEEVIKYADFIIDWREKVRLDKKHALPELLKQVSSSHKDL